MTGAEALAQGVRRLRNAEVSDPGRDARRLLAHVLGIEPGRLTLVLPEAISPTASADYDAILSRREKREPVSHLVGSRLFWGREFLVSADVLDPRPETEILVGAALERPFRRVLDLGTGTGCILLTLLAERPGTDGVGLDLSPAALRVAQANAARLGLGDRVSIRRSDWFEAAEGRFDLIVSNPPYIALDEIAALEPEVRYWEPHMALTDGGDGLSAYRSILAGAEAVLEPGGRLLLEIGPTQAASVAEIGRTEGWGGCEVRRDLDGRARVCLFEVP